jgi:uncharacterized iron-regulated membrane protein
MARGIWRAAVITHRYLGVAVGLLMLMWFATGIVMIYVPYPGLSQEQSLKAAASIPWQSCCDLDTPQFEADDAIYSARLVTVAGDPVLTVRQSSASYLSSDISRSTAEPYVFISAERASAIAKDTASRILGTVPKIAQQDEITVDQWTIGGVSEKNGTLFRVRFDDPQRTILYVSGATGDTVLWTTRAQRFWNWVGAIPHWLYFSQLRQNGSLWLQIIIWTSLAGGFLTMLGLYIGISQFKRRRSGRYSPYRGWFYWHHIIGLVFGALVLTWVVSGTLSVSPWGILDSKPDDAAARISGTPPWKDVKASLAAIMAKPPQGDVVELRSAILGGELFWLASHRDGTVMRLDRNGNPASMPASALDAAAKRLAGASAIESAGLITRADSYYFGFHGYLEHSATKLPVYRVVLANEDHTRYYLDPDNGELLLRTDAGARSYRWWFNAPHRFDFAAWLRWRPLWDIVVLVLLLGGLTATGTGVYLAIRRVKRDLTFKR